MPGREQLTAIVLAAGLSRRAFPAHKLLLDWRGKTVLRATVEAIVAAECGEVLVVTGHRRDEVGAALEGLPVRCVEAADYARGMGHSLSAGVRAARPGAAGFLVSVGDLPRLSAPPVRAVVDAFLAAGAAFHVVPRCAGRRGHPVLLGGWLRPRLAVLEGDTGARQLLASPPEADRVRFLELADASIFQDVDAAGDA